MLAVHIFIKHTQFNSNSYICLQMLDVIAMSAITSMSFRNASNVVRCTCNRGADCGSLSHHFATRYISDDAALRGDGRQTVFIGKRAACCKR